MAIGDKVKDLTSSAKRRVGAEAPLAADEDGNVGVVRGALRAFGQGDMDAFTDALNDDVIWESPEGENFPGAGNHKGPDEIRQSFIGDVGRTYTSFGFVPESFLETDKEDAVVVIGRFKGDGAEGDNVDTPGVQVWGFKGSEVNHVRIFTDSAAFPEVITEEMLEKQKEEDRKKEEEEKKKKDEEDDSDDDSSTEGKSDDESGDDDSDDDDSDDDSDDDDSGARSESKDDTDDSDDDDDDSDDDEEDSGPQAESKDDTENDSSEDEKGEGDKPDDD